MVGSEWEKMYGKGKKRRKGGREGGREGGEGGE